MSAVRTIFIFAAGAAAGFIVSDLSGTVREELVRRDSVTISRRDLHHLTRAIEKLKDSPSDRGYARYESESGKIAFECPTEHFCNLNVTARAREEAREPRILNSSVTEIAPLGAQPDAVGIYERFGLVSGDVIAEINGERLSDPAAALKKLGELRPGSLRTTELKVVRAGQPLKLRYRADGT